MHLIHQILIFFATFAHGSDLRNISTLFDCLSNCFDDSCWNVCNDLQDEYIFPQVDEDTQADINLHCTSMDTMMIKFNPGTYIIEQSTPDYAWSFVNAITGSLTTISNLTSGTAYRYRLYNLTKDGISRPATSDWFSTFDADYVPLSVKNITLLRFNADETNMYELRAEIAFEPAEDRSCKYNVLTWDGKHEVYYFNLEYLPEFRFEAEHFKFGHYGNVSIASVNTEDTEISPMTSIKFFTISCLEYYDNLTVCAPESVKGLRTEHIQREGGLYDLMIYWNKSVHEPDNYTIQIVLNGDRRNVYYVTVPGNTTEYFTPNVKLGSRYSVAIFAESPGGISIPTTIDKRVTKRHAKKKSYYEIVIIGTTLLIIIVIVVAMICLQYYKQKKKNFSMECTHFEDPPIEIKKLLPQNYDFEINNSVPLTQTRDKFELCPKHLKFKGILGSGAYGIVRLGSLRDKFDNVTDVAVKTLKDKPSMEDLKNFRKEILIMRFVGQHPNIVSLIGYCILHNKPALVVEYCCKGDLQTYLRAIWERMVSVAFNHTERFKFDADPFNKNGIKYLSNNSGKKEHNYEDFQVIVNRVYDIQQDISQYTEVVTANDLLNFARQIAMGMEFLSSNRIVHRDLAARNVLVCTDRIVKISDFGLSRDVYQDNLYKKKGSGKLPLKWMAIESLTHQIYTTHSDVWSFGILLWEIVTMGAIPYPGIPTDAVPKLLKSGYKMERPPCCSIELYNIMLSCWNIRPQSRPTFTQLKENLDKLLSSHSENKYLNMDEMICET